jgi:hypothetical protein
MEWIDIRYPPSHELVKRMSDPKLHWKPITFSVVLMIPTFARVAAETGYEC